MENKVKRHLTVLKISEIFLGEVVESKDKYLKYRFKIMEEKKRIRIGKIIFVDIRYEMRLKTNTYKKNEFFIDNLVKKLNG